MKKYKGFTLVELLAVLVIISLLLTISVIAYNKVSKQAKQELYSSLIKTLKTNAAKYGEDNIDDIEKNAQTISINKLIEEGYVDGDNNCNQGQCIINPITNQELGGSFLVYYSEGRIIAEYESNIFNLSFENQGSKQTDSISVVLNIKDLPASATNLSCIFKIDDNSTEYVGIISNNKCTYTFTVNDGHFENVYDFMSGKLIKNHIITANVSVNIDDKIKTQTASKTFSVKEEEMNTEYCLKAYLDSSKRNEYLGDWSNNTNGIYIMSSCSDSLSTYQYRLNDNTEWTTMSGNYLQLNNEGITHLYTRKIIDTNNFVTSYPYLFNIKLDRIAPTCSPFTGLNNENNNVTTNLSIYNELGESNVCNAIGANDGIKPCPVKYTTNCLDSGSGCANETYSKDINGITDITGPTSKACNNGTIIKTGAVTISNISDKAGNTTDCSETGLPLYCSVSLTCPTVKVTTENGNLNPGVWVNKEITYEIEPHSTTTAYTYNLFKFTTNINDKTILANQTVSNNGKTTLTSNDDGFKYLTVTITNGTLSQTCNYGTYFQDVTPPVVTSNIYFYDASKTNNAGNAINDTNGISEYLTNPSTGVFITKKSGGTLSTPWNNTGRTYKFTSNDNLSGTSYNTWDYDTLYSYTELTDPGAACELNPSLDMFTCGAKNYDLSRYITLTGKGDRRARYTVCDKANNCTYINIKNKIDKSAPVIIVTPYDYGTENISNGGGITTAVTTDLTLGWNKIGHTYKFNMSDEGAGFYNSTWYYNTSNVFTDSGKNGAYTTSTTLIDTSRTTSLTGQGFRRAKLTARDQAGNTQNVYIIDKIDKTAYTPYPKTKTFENGAGILVCDTNNDNKIDFVKNFISNSTTNVGLTVMSLTPIKCSTIAKHCGESNCSIINGTNYFPEENINYLIQGMTVLSSSGPCTATYSNGQWSSNTESCSKSQSIGKAYYNQRYVSTMDYAGNQSEKLTSRSYYLTSSNYTTLLNSINTYITNKNYTSLNTALVDYISWW